MLTRFLVLLTACFAALAPARAQGTSSGGSVSNQIAAPPIALPKDPTNTDEYPCYYYGYGVDFENITDVELNFGVSSRLEGELVIDSLEFTQ
jgi:hypothetical protein